MAFTPPIHDKERIMSFFKIIHLNQMALSSLRGVTHFVFLKLFEKFASNDFPYGVN